MKKKVLACIIAIVVVFTVFAACGKKEDTTPKVENLTAELSEIVDSIYEKKDPGLKLSTNEIDLTNADSVKAFTGLDSADKLQSAVFSEPMMSSQAYSLVLMRLKDSADAESVATEVKNGVNPAKWICVCADEPAVVAYGDVVLMVMVDPELADTVTADEIVSAFAEICGGALTIEQK